MLNGSHMQNDTGFAPDHAWQEVLVASHSRKQIHTERLLPVFVGQGRIASIRSIRSADTVHQDVDPAPLAKDTIGKLLYPGRTPQVRLNEKRGPLTFGQRGAGGRGDLRSRQKKAAYHGLTGAFGSTRHQDPPIFELLWVGRKRIVIVHLGISSVAQERVCHYTP